MVGILELISPLSVLIDRIIPDKDAAARAKIELIKEENKNAIQQLNLFLQADVQQTDTNKVEAANDSLFVAGWRPFVGWVCGVSFAYHYIIQPAIAFVLAANHAIYIMPSFDTSELNTVLFGMLGIGSLRTLEKVTKSQISVKG